MVSFRTLATAALALAAPISAAITPTQVVDNIKTLTAKSQALQAPAQSISIINGPLVIIGQGPFPKIIVGFQDIVVTGTTYISQMGDMANVPAGKQSDDIYDAFREFVRTHRALLNILIGKAGLFQTVPLIGEPMSAVLRQVEGVTDTLAISLTNKVQSRTSDLQNQAGSLSMTLRTCIDSYQGLSLNKRSLRYAQRAAVAA